MSHGKYPSKQIFFKKLGINQYDSKTEQQKYYKKKKRIYYTSRSLVEKLFLKTAQHRHFGNS